MSGKYILDSEENREFLKSMTENLIQFGRRFPSSEGASYYLGDDGTPLTGRDRETWITCRMAHVYLHLSTKIGHKFLNFLQLISFFKQSIVLIYSSFFGLVDPIRFSMIIKPAFALLTQLWA